MPHVTVVVEGISDAAIARRLCSVAGVGLARAPIIAGGKGKLDPKLQGYNNAAAYSPWLVLRDLDHDAACAADLRSVLLPEPAPSMLLRFPVHSIESWLIADRHALANFLRVQVSSVPRDPEALPRPKRAIVDMARSSRSRAIAGDLVPIQGSSVEVGPGYTARITEFALNHWDPERASAGSDSLRRCLIRLREL